MPARPPIGTNPWGSSFNSYDDVARDSTTGNLKLAALVAALGFTPDRVFNVKDAAYGALGDGSHDDTTAIQAAIDAAAAVGGGYVVIPGSANVYRCTNELQLKTGVHLVGHGRSATQLSWASDLGAGKYAIKNAAGTGIQQLAPSVSHLHLNGPGQGVMSLGSLGGLAMRGLKLGVNVRAYDISAFWFRAGLAVDGNHNLIEDCKFSSNYYNVEYIDNPQSKGNQTFNNVQCDGALFAAVAVFGNNIIDGCIFNRVEVGISPMGFYKADGASASTNGMMAQTVLTGVAWEGIGNRAMLDESTGGGSGSDSISFCTFDCSGWSQFEPAVKIAARDQAYVVELRTVTGLRFRGGAYPFYGGSTATWKFGNAGDNELDLGTAFVGAPGVTFGSGTQITRIKRYLNSGWTMTSAGTVATGDILEWSGAYDTVQRYTGTNGYAGVAGNAATAGGSVYVINEGEADILCESIAGSGVYIASYTTTKHHGTAASSGDLVVAVSAGPGGGSGGSACRCLLTAPTWKA